MRRRARRVPPTLDSTAPLSRGVRRTRGRSPAHALREGKAWGPYRRRSTGAMPGDATRCTMCPRQRARPRPSAQALVGVGGADVQCSHAHGAGPLWARRSRSARSATEVWAGAGIGATKSIIDHGFGATGEVELGATLLQLRGDLAASLAQSGCAGWLWEWLVRPAAVRSSSPPAPALVCRINAHPCACARPDDRAAVHTEQS